jgi:hypothetical protein
MSELVECGCERVKSLEAALETTEWQHRNVRHSFDVLCAVVNAIHNKYGMSDESWSEVVQDMYSNNTEYAFEEIADILSTFCDIDESVFRQDYTVHFSIPAFFSLTIKAHSEEDAEEKGYEEAQNMWPNDISNSDNFEIDTYSVEIVSVQKESE